MFAGGDNFAGLGAAAAPIHGGELLRAARLYQRSPEAWLDLSTALNPRPWPVPPLEESLFWRLPDADGRLERAAQRYYHATELVAAAGSQALIQCLPQLRPPCRVRLCATAYQEHAYHWRLHGHQVELYDENQPPQQVMPKQAPPDVLIVINPNGHNAQHIAPHLLLEWWRRLQAHGGWLIVDEAFADTIPRHSMSQHTERPGLLVLRSFGKFFGLAGIRLGFALCAPPLAEQLRRHLGPWPVSGPTRHIGELALADTPWQKRMRRWLDAASRRLETLLRKHLQAYPVRLWRRTGLAVYLHLEHIAAIEIQHRLALQGVLLRRIPTPAGGSWLRCGLYDDRAAPLREHLGQALQMGSSG